MIEIPHSLESIQAAGVGSGLFVYAFSDTQDSKWGARIRAADSSSGSLLWSKWLPNAGVNDIIVRNGSVFVGTSSARGREGPSAVLSLNGRSGHKNWTYSLAKYNLNMLWVAGNIVVVDGDVHVLRDDSGHERWRIQEKGEIVWSLAVQEAGVYVGTDHGKIESWSINSGRRMASINVGRPVSQISVGNDRVVAVTQRPEDEGFHVLSLPIGLRKCFWSVKVRGESASSAIPLSVNDSAYLVATGVLTRAPSALLSLDGNSGKRKNDAMNIEGQSAPVVLSKRGMFAVGERLSNVDGKIVYRLDPVMRKLTKTYIVEGGLFGPFLGEDGQVYGISGNRRLILFQ